MWGKSPQVQAVMVALGKPRVLKGQIGPGFRAARSNRKVTRMGRSHR